MKIMSLNVNRFNLDHDDQIGDAFSLDRLMKKTANTIRAFLDKYENSLVVLQEVPFYRIVYKNIKRNVFDLFCDEFSADTYKLFIPEKPAYICTMAISKEGTWEQRLSIFQPNDDCKNRFIEVGFQNQITLLGVHMPNDDDCWRLLKKYAVQHSSDNTIIIGDFNAHNNAHRSSERRNDFNDLTKDKKYLDAIDNETITFFEARTTVDHILYTNRAIICNASVEKEQSYYDHALITADIQLQ